MLARLCDERTVVCALQNGVEQVERVGHGPRAGDPDQRVVVPLLAAASDGPG